MAVHRGKLHDYLGMRIDLSSVGKARITMHEYID